MEFGPYNRLLSRMYERTNSPVATADAFSTPHPSSRLVSLHGSETTPAARYLLSVVHIELQERGGRFDLILRSSKNVSSTRYSNFWPFQPSADVAELIPAVDTYMFIALILTEIRTLASTLAPDVLSPTYLSSRVNEQEFFYRETLRSGPEEAICIHLFRPTYVSVQRLCVRQGVPVFPS